MFDEDRIVKMGEQPIHASWFFDVAPAREMGDSTSNPMGDRVDADLGFLRVGIGPSMSGKSESRIHEVPEPIEFGERGAVTGGPVDHGDCE